MPYINTDKTPSIFGGAMLIAGTIVGAGMFSLPVVMAGSWFSWAIITIIITWFCMYVSGLMLLEANLNYPIGSSFDTITKDLLGKKWNIATGISVAFVLYILTYAYISAGGAVISLTIKENIGVSLPDRFTGLVFALVLASIVWTSTAAVNRMTAFVLGVKIITFILVFGSLIFNIDRNILLDTNDTGASYMPYIMASLPFGLASFGFHGNVPSLMKYYGKKPGNIQKCLFWGTLIALSLYIFWLTGTMGNISRTEFSSIIAKGGNIDALVGSIGNIITNKYTHYLMIIFSNVAVASSFLGVTLGLFDYISDLFKFDNSALGRFKAALVTFTPPIIGAQINPNGFIYAIGFAGLAASLWAVIVPALLAKQSRVKFKNQIFQVFGGSIMIKIIIIFGLINIIAHILLSLDLIPVFK